jgi:Mrp family chromosome partitioning ATPase
MAGELNFEDVLERVPVAERRNGARAELTMDVLFSGPPPPNPTEMLESDRMRELLIHAQATYDLVIIDSPPIAVVPDAIPLIPQVSGVLVVSRVGHSTRDAIRRLHDQLTNMKAPTLGIVVNGIRVDEGGYYGYYGYESGARNGTPTSHADQFLEADTTKAEIR